MSRKIQGYLVLTTAVLIAISLLAKQFNWLLFQNVTMILAAFIAGYPIFRKAISAIHHKIIGIELLVTVAVTGAMLIGEYWEAAAVTFLFMLGSYLESRTLDKTRASLESLIQLSPAQATVLLDGREQILAADDVEIGDTVIVRPGERIPVDGTITKGHASINQASITGESIPVYKELADDVFSGTLNETGYIEIEANQVGDDTTLAKIIELVEEAQESKAKTQKFLERFAKYYTPIILVLAVILWVVTKDIRLPLTLLVISCPGALVISVPVSIVNGIGNGARNGVLIKGGESIENLSRIDVVAFDKTGTLTKGSPQVTRIQSFDRPETELLALVASAEKNSEHPLAKAIVRKAEESGTSLFPSPDQFEVLRGQGIRATFDNETLYIGNRQLIKQYVDVLDTETEKTILHEEELGQTVVIVATATKLLGLLSLADQIKDDAYTIVHRLKEKGIKKVIMLTGDNPRAAMTVATKLGLDAVHAECLPTGKVDAIKEYQRQGFKVAMVGDGINDAPALATADTSIAMGVMGSDVAMETADVVLMKDQLSQLTYLFGLSRFTVTNMKQNIFFSIATVILLITGVIFNKVFMTGGMLIHELSVLIVIANALRIIAFGKKMSNPKSQAKGADTHGEQRSLSA